MTSETVKAPPYPNNLASMEDLHTRLLDLSAWLGSQHEWAHEFARKHGLPADKELFPVRPQPPTVIQLNSFSFYSVLYAYMTMRLIRHRWDDIVRSHESDWYSDLCRQRRLACLKDAGKIFTYVLIPLERRELINLQERTANGNPFKNMLRSFGLPIDLVEESFGEDAEPRDLAGEDYSSPEEDDAWPT